MSIDQKHIINKLSVDVVTNSSSSAFELKDNISVFLKEDILPYLENYFSTIEEDLHDQVLQIPYLSVDVASSSTLNYKELKEDVKRALTKEIKRKTKIAHLGSEEVTLSTVEKSKEKTFLHFLERGISPWWIRSEDSFEVTPKDFHELLESKSFQRRLQVQLMNASFRYRMIQQLSDDQIGQVLSATIISEDSNLLENDMISKIEQMQSQDRQAFWDTLIDYFLQNDPKSLVSRLIFQLCKKFSPKHKELTTLSKESKVFIQVIALMLTRLHSDSQAKEALKILDDHRILHKVINPMKTEVEGVSTTSQLSKTESTSTSEVAFTSSEDEKVVDSKALTKDAIIKSKEIDTEAIARKNDESANQAIENSKTRSTSYRIQPKKDISREKEFSAKDEEAKDLLGEVTAVPTNSEIQEDKIRVEGHNSSEIHESLHQLIDQEDRLLFEELETIKSEHHPIPQEIHISNAGLILLHPYLQPFLKNCGLLDEDNQILDQDIAVHLFHYLATKKEQQYENNMVFEKILCGVPVEQSIRRTVHLSDELKANTEELLQAVLDNWGVLKNASPDLLRGEFLQRFGKISFKEVNPKITVERKVHDILLDKLPWNIGVSRLPWLDYLLFTDW